jgi:hypothetical protein
LKSRSIAMQMTTPKMKSAPTNFAIGPTATSDSSCATSAFLM